MQKADITCKNCGNQFTGKFCNQCGEKIYTEHDRTFGHFLGEAFHFLTHFDNKVLKSWWLVMTRPGYVSLEIVNGVRKPYYKPINLFILGVILYLLFPFFEGLNIPLKYHQQELYRSAAVPMIQHKMEKKKLTFEQLSEKYNAKSPKFAKILLLVIIPLTAFLIQILFLKKGRYFFDYMTLSSEINTFYLYFMFFIVPLLFMTAYIIGTLFGQDIRPYLNDNISTPVHAIVVGMYTRVAFTRLFKEPGFRTILKSIIFLIIHWLIIYTVYRFILLSVVLFFI